MFKHRLWIILGIAAALAGSSASFAVASAGAAGTTWHVISHPIDPRLLTEMPFGTRSHWVQPWRSTLVTRPATWLRDAIGINFNVQPQEAAATARLLHASGFRRVRLEIPWDAMSYSHPSQLTDPARWRAYISAFRKNRLRPLILLNANHGGPGPMTQFELTLTARAARGARRLALSAAAAREVVPGLTGLDAQGMAAGVLITHVGPNHVARLSRPLPMAVHRGPAPATTLRYRPFARPFLGDGRTPNPRFERTLGGWLAYAKHVCQFVRAVYGSDRFDVEVWNELTFGSNFLNESRYFSPLPDPRSTGDVPDVLLARTVRMLHNPADRLPDVQVGDGFSNEVPWVSGAIVPPGTDAIDHHPYRNPIVFPGPRRSVSPVDNAGVKPLDALGDPSYVLTHGGGFADAFTPHYRVFMPEYFLTGIATETLVRDLSPIHTTIYGTAHGAGTHPPGSRPPQNWITETGMDVGQARSDGMPARESAEFEAKAALRFFVSYASEGVRAIDLYAAAGGGCCQLIPQRFFGAVDVDPGSYPAQLGGQTMQAVQRLSATLTGAQHVASPRQLRLNAIATTSNHAQFAGNGTAAHPPLYDRDVLAFFPFELTPRSFVVAVYVMTRDLTHYYRSSRDHYDMPPETYRLSIGDVNGTSAGVSATDPRTGDQVPVRIVSRSPSQIIVQLPVTDSPRMLSITDGGLGH